MEVLLWSFDICSVVFRIEALGASSVDVSIFAADNLSKICVRNLFKVWYLLIGMHRNCLSGVSIFYNYAEPFRRVRCAPFFRVCSTFVYLSTPVQSFLAMPICFFIFSLYDFFVILAFHFFELRTNKNVQEFFFFITRKPLLLSNGNAKSLLTLTMLGGKKHCLITKKRLLSDKNFRILGTTFLFRQEKNSQVRFV